jgi:hypothetical protein
MAAFWGVGSSSRKGQQSSDGRVSTATLHCGFVRTLQLWRRIGIQFIWHARGLGGTKARSEWWGAEYTHRPKSLFIVAVNAVDLCLLKCDVFLQDR